MGNTLDSNDNENISSKLRELSRYQHSLLGPVRRVHHLGLKLDYLVLEKSYISKNDYEKALKQFQKRVKLVKVINNPTKKLFVSVLNFQNNEINELCGKMYKIFLFLKPFDTDLQEVYLKRRKSKHHFQERELLSILSDIAECLTTLYDHNIHPSVLTLPGVVFEGQSLKIIDQQLINRMNMIESFRFRAELERGTYLAPQILRNISNDQELISMAKTYVFTLGVLGLQLAALKDMDRLYNYEDLQIDFQRMYSEINCLPYSSKFKELLQSMLQVDPFSRKGIAALSFQLSEQCNSKFGKDWKQNTPSIIIDQRQVNLEQDPTFILLGSRRPHKKNSDLFVQTPRYIGSQWKSSISLARERAVSDHLKLKYLREEVESRNQPLQRQYKKQTLSQHPSLTNHTRNKSFSLLSDKNYVCELSERHAEVLPISPISYERPTKVQEKPLSIAKKIWVKDRDSFISRDRFEQQDCLAHQNRFNQQDHLTEDGSSVPSFQRKQRQGYNTEQKEAYNQAKFRKWLENQKKNFHIDYQPFQFNSSFRKNDAMTKNTHKTPSRHKLSPSQDNKLSSPTQLERILPKLNQINEDLPLQTPIKSLELIQTDRRRSKKSSQKKNYGRYSFSNGSVYEGEFNEANEFEGNGILYYPNGEIFYSGNWKANKFHGYGLLNNYLQKSLPLGQFPTNYEDFNRNDPNAWSQYQGEFSEDRKNGYGTLYFRNGDKFSGCFVQDGIQGYGSFFKKEVLWVTGIWQNSILIDK